MKSKHIGLIILILVIGATGLFLFLQSNQTEVMQWIIMILH